MEYPCHLSETSAEYIERVFRKLTSPLEFVIEPRSFHVGCCGRVFLQATSHL